MKKIMGTSADSLALGKTSAGEKVCYGLGGVGYQITLALSNAFLTLYYTDSVLISASYVGAMMFVARLLDGMSDIAMGLVIEKTKTRIGKARPWVMIGAIPLALSMVLLFNVPSSLAPLPKNIYVFLTYVFMSVASYTVVAIAHSAMLPRISLVSADRNITTVVLALMQGIMTAVLVGLFAPMLSALGGESSQHAWTIISLLIAVISLLLLTLCFLVTKEKLSAIETPEAKENTVNPQKSSLKSALMFLLKSKYFYIIVILYLTLAVTNGTAGIGIYFMRDVLGNKNLMGIFSIIGIIPMIIMMPLVPKLFSVFGKKKTLLVSLGIVMVVKAVMIILPTNLTVQLVCTFFSTLTFVPLWVATPTMICDLVDYIDYKKGIRTEGLATSASSFGTKLGTGLGSVILGIVLTIGGYNPLLEAQSEGTKTAIIFIMIGIPIVLCALCFLCITLWNMEKFKPEVEQYIAESKNILTGKQL